MIEEIMSSHTVILGCGNVLFGDDGFGPAVIEALEQRGRLSSRVAAVDVGTSISDLLFDLALSQQRPGRVFIVDAVSVPGRSPGEVFELPLADIPAGKTADFSMHQFPSVNLLHELCTDGGVEVRIIAVQVKDIPDHVQPGLSTEVSEAIPQICRKLEDLCH